MNFPPSPHTELGTASPTLSLEELREPNTLAKLLLLRPDPLSTFLHDALGDASKQALTAWQPPDPPSRELVTSLLIDLNAIISNNFIWSEPRFAQVQLRCLTRRMLKSLPGDTDIIRLNRLLLEDAYPEVFYPTDSQWSEGSALLDAYLDALKADPDHPRSSWEDAFVIWLYPRVLKLMRRFGSEEADAPDYTQATLCKIIEALRAQHLSPRSLSGWVYVIAHRTFLNAETKAHKRRIFSFSRFRREDQSGGDDLHLGGGNLEAAATTVEELELESIIAKCLESLKRSHSQEARYWGMRHDHGLPVFEIAALEEVEEQKVSDKISTAKKLLARCVEKNWGRP